MKSDNFEVGFTERTYRLKSQNGCYTWRYDDTGKQVFPRVWKTKEGAIRWANNRFKDHSLTFIKPLVSS